MNWGTGGGFLPNQVQKGVGNQNILHGPRSFISKKRRVGRGGGINVLEYNMVWNTYLRCKETFSHTIDGFNLLFKKKSN